MKTSKTFIHPGRTVIAVAGVAAVLSFQTARGSIGSGGTVCLFDPSACERSMVLAKGVPKTWAFAGVPLTVELPINLYITCPPTNYCGAVCANPAVIVSASITVNLYPGVTPPPLAPLPPPVASGAISTGGGTMPMPVSAPLGSGFNTNIVPIIVPTNVARGFYVAVGIATVAFSDGMILTQRGDTTICLVDPAPDQPGVPRLSLELLSDPFPRMAPGDQAVVTYRITNNDPSNSIPLIVSGTSKQGAVRPQGSNETHGVYSISSPFGSDFPIYFNPGSNCIPLPSHPYTQPLLSSTLPPLGPHQSNTITIGIRSWGQCADGSCSESTLRVQGVFTDNSPAFACAGMSLLVDTAAPSQNCGTAAVNDCNQNGIPDALDIASRRSADQNFNAMPDECEAIINFPVFAGVTPGTVMPGAPIQVELAFNEAVPMLSVFANGASLVRTQFFGAPFWVGTIPADQRPGPQTVYFLGKDILNGITSYIAPYQVANVDPLSVTRISIDSGNHVILEHNGAGFGPNVFVEETTEFNLPWLPRPDGPHASPHDAGPAIETRFFRLSMPVP